MRAHLDIETCSPLDLTKVGVYRYVEDPDTSIWLFSYRLDDSPSNGCFRWRPGWEPPFALLDHIAFGEPVVAHNANFERQIWNAVIRRLAGSESWPRLSIEQMDCTMSRALAVHLPADLETLAQVLDLSEQKDKEGRRLMLQMSKPRKREQSTYQTCPKAAWGQCICPKGMCLEPSTIFTWWDEPEKIERLAAYCDQDVATECAIDAKLPPLSPDERAIWELDQRINDRGVALDVESIHR